MWIDITQNRSFQQRKERKKTRKNKNNESNIPKSIEINKKDENIPKHRGLVPEDGGSMFLRNVGISISSHDVTTQKTNSDIFAADVRLYGEEIQLSLSHYFRFFLQAM
jgi:hypothetical protein